MNLLEAKIEIHDTLNPKIWSSNNQLLPNVSEKCKEIVVEFVKGLANNDIPAVILDAWIVGSNASYNYTEFSDLDLHIIVNTEAATNCPDLLSKLYDFYRNNFNKKYDISLHGVSVELYLEDVHASTITNGIYSLFQNRWLKEPKKLPPMEDIDIDDLIKKYEDLYTKVIAREYDPAQLIDDLYLLRKTSIAVDGEFGKGNLVFKDFRNRGILDDLRERAAQNLGQKLSLK